MVTGARRNAHSAVSRRAMSFDTLRASAVTARSAAEHASDSGRGTRSRVSLTACAPLESALAPAGRHPPDTTSANRHESCAARVCGAPSRPPQPARPPPAARSQASPGCGRSALRGKRPSEERHSVCSLVAAASSGGRRCPYAVIVCTLTVLFYRAATVLAATDPAARGIGAAASSATRAASTCAWAWDRAWSPRRAPPVSPRADKDDPASPVSASCVHCDVRSG